jgi:hypothetical protein
VHIDEIHERTEDNLHIANRNALVECLESVAALQGVEVGVSWEESLTKVKKEDQDHCQQPGVQSTCSVSQECLCQIPWEELRKPMKRLVGKKKR